MTAAARTLRASWNALRFAVELAAWLAGPDVGVLVEELALHIMFRVLAVQPAAEDLYDLA